MCLLNSDFHLIQIPCSRFTTRFILHPQRRHRRYLPSYCRRLLPPNPAGPLSSPTTRHMLERRALFFLHTKFTPRLSEGKRARSAFQSCISIPKEWAHPCAWILPSVSRFSSDSVRTAPFNSADDHWQPIFPRSVVIDLSNSIAMLSSRMSPGCPSFIPQYVGYLLSDHRNRYAPSRLHTLRAHCALCANRSAKSETVTPFFSSQPIHSSSLFLTLKSVSPLSATLTKTPLGYTPPSSEPSCAPDGG